MIRFNAPHAIKLISEWTSVPFIATHHTCIARYDSKDCIMAGVFYTDYNIASVQIHVAAFQHTWLSREFLKAAFDFPFNTLKVKKLLGLVRSSNLRAIKLDLRLGFVLETTVKDVFPDGDMLVFSMTRESCRYLTLGGNYGEASSDAR